MKFFFCLYGWIFVRPRRWFFGRMIRLGSWKVRWRFERNKLWYPEAEGYYDKYLWPNPHWVFLYRTVFKFFNWLRWEGWRPFCDWTGGYRRTYPWIARVIHRIGETTAGVHISSGVECWHCASVGFDQGTLSEDETGATFILVDSGTTSTPDGTDHWFRGITICPRCGFRDEYSDGSL